MARRNTPASGAPGGTKLLYPIHEGPQYNFMVSTAEEVLYGGAAGGGKSYALRAMLVAYCLEHPGATAVLFRRTFRELEDTHILRLQLELPSYVATYKASSHDFLFANGSILMLRFCEKEEDVRCVGIDTPILTSDLRWIKAGELKEGDSLLGFEEEQSAYRQKRQLQKATVTRHRVTNAKTHRIHLANGQIIDATPEHRWLVCINGGLIWRSTAELYVIQESNDSRYSRPLTLRQAVRVILQDYSYNSGFLAAALDGEGCLSADKERHTGLELNFVQKSNAMLEKVRLLFAGYKTGEYQRADVRVIRSYGTAQNMEILMRTQPPRLLDKWGTLVASITIPRVADIEIKHIDPIEIREIAEITSSSGTYVAAGFLAHNTYDTFECDIMAFDELTAFSEFQYTYLTSRCRSTKSWWPGRRIRAATNPGNVGHVWVKKRWIDFALPGEVKQGPEDEGNMTRQFIPARITDNPTLMRYSPNYMAQLRALPEEEYRAKALGDWDIFSGQFFSRWRPSVHVVPDFAIPSSWKRYIFVDWGIAVPRAVYWAARPEGTNFIWLYREQYGAGVPTREQARVAAQATRAGEEKIEMIVVDPAMFAKEHDADGNVMKSPADYWKEEFQGIADVVRGNNERIQGASLFRECLDWTGIEGADGIQIIVPPRLRVFKSCVNFCKTIPSLIHSKVNVEDVDTDGDDHSYDSVRYGLRYLFAAPARPKGMRVIDTPTGLVVLPA